MNLLEQALWVIAGWFADHSFPALAGFIGGLIGGEVHNRWRNRKPPKDT